MLLIPGKYSQFGDTRRRDIGLGRERVPSLAARIASKLSAPRKRRAPESSEQRRYQRKPDVVESNSPGGAHHMGRIGEPIIPLLQGTSQPVSYKIILIILSRFLELIREVPGKIAIRGHCKVIGYPLAKNSSLLGHRHRRV